MIGFDIEKHIITGIRILSHEETPGLGANAAEPSFINQFQDISTDAPLTVVKNEPASEDEIQAVTAATITSKAVTSGVNEARAHFMENF